MIAEYDGEPAGAVLLSVSTLSPLNLEPTVHSIAPCVAAGFRRRGVGHTLMEAAVTYAEELGIGHVLTAAAYSSRSEQPVHGPARARPAGGPARGGDADHPQQAHRAAPGKIRPSAPARWARSSRHAVRCAASTPPRETARSGPSGPACR